MRVCYNNHEEVAHEGWDCPVCTLIEEYEVQILEIRQSCEEQLETITELKDKYLELLKEHNPELLI